MKIKPCHEEGIEPKKEKKGASSVMHPDHRAQTKRINRARGQLDGVQRMIDERRYCVDIVTQIRAVRSALGALEAEIIETHLRGCVRAAFARKDAFDVEEKIKEIMKIIS